MCKGVKLSVNPYILGPSYYFYNVKISSLISNIDKN